MHPRTRASSESRSARASAGQSSNVAGLRAEWRALKHGTPGRRFEDRYENSRHTHSRVTIVGRVVRIVLAVISFAIGVVLVFIPGPAILFFAVAGALFAAESRTVARLLDWTEVRIRKLVSWLLGRWRSLSWPGKIAAGTAVVAAAAAFCYWSYDVMFG